MKDLKINITFKTLTEISKIADYDDYGDFLHHSSDTPFTEEMLRLCGKAIKALYSTRRDNFKLYDGYEYFIVEWWMIKDKKTELWKVLYEDIE